MVRLQTTLARIACVVVIVITAYRVVLEKSADWPARIVGIVLSCLFLLYLLFQEEVCEESSWQERIPGTTRSNHNKRKRIAGAPCLTTA
jgi:hypothetical protein